MSGYRNNEVFKANFVKRLMEAGNRADDLTRKVAEEMMKAMVRRSPVDTGRFRGNWQTGVNVTNVGSNNASDTTGDSSLARLREILRGWQAGQTIYMTNALPYAKRLEYGWSQQAPQGMVRLTIAEFGQHLRASAEEAKK